MTGKGNEAGSRESRSSVPCPLFPVTYLPLLATAWLLEPGQVMLEQLAWLGTEVMPAFTKR